MRLEEMDSVPREWSVFMNRWWVMASPRLAPLSLGSIYCCYKCRLNYVYLFIISRLTFAMLCLLFIILTLSYTFLEVKILTPWRRVLFEKLRVFSQEIPPHFKESEDLISPSKVPATSEAVQSSPCSQPIYWTSILMLSSHLLLGISSGLFPSRLPTKTVRAPLLFPYVLHAPPISFFFIWWHE